MNASDEPLYLVLARSAVQCGSRLSPVFVQELVSRIDRDAAALKDAQAVALEEAADAIEPRMMQFFKVTQDLNDPHRAWLRARAHAVRGEA